MINAAVVGVLPPVVPDVFVFFIFLFFLDLLVCLFCDSLYRRDDLPGGSGALDSPILLGSSA